MFCILVTGIPASGKSTLARYFSENLKLPMISKDSIKEILFDTVGFKSRAEKVALGNAAMDTMYYFAEQLMLINQPFILENNFENASKNGLERLLDQYDYKAITICLTGEYDKIYQRFLDRNNSPKRHRGHVVNDCYPEDEEKKQKSQPISFEDYVKSITERGMADFKAKGPQILVDTTYLENIDSNDILQQLKKKIDEIL